MSDYPVSIEIPVLWGDLDSFGHVNNARYFTWIEAARMAYFDAVGVQTSGRDMDVGPILATTSCSFRTAVTYPDTVVVRATVSRIGNTSFTMGYRVERASGDVVAEASAVIVMVDYRTDQKVRVPEAIRSAIATVQGSG